MYEYTPIPNRRPGIALAFICFLSAAVLFMPVEFSYTVMLLMRCVALWLFLCGLLVTERYVLTQFTYSIEYSGDVCEFVVTETRMKRMRTVCRVSSVCLTDYAPVGRGKSKYKPQKGTRRYNYCPDLVSTDRKVLLIEDGDGRTAVVLRPDDKLDGILKMLTNKH